MHMQIRMNVRTKEDRAEAHSLEKGYKTLYMTA